MKDRKPKYALAMTTTRLGGRLLVSSLFKGHFILFLS